MVKTALFFALVIFFYMLHAHDKMSVSVHICEKDELTTYFSVSIPPKHLKLGSCYMKTMPREDYRVGLRSFQKRY